MLFLTMHGIDSDHRARPAMGGEQSLDRRRFHWTFRRNRDVPAPEAFVGSEGAEYVRGATVEKVVEASSRGYVIDRHMTLTFPPFLASFNTAAWRRNAASTEAGSSCQQDATDRPCKPETLPPRHAERFAQPGDVNIDEAVDQSDKSWRRRRLPRSQTARRAAGDRLSPPPASGLGFLAGQQMN